MCSQWGVSVHTKVLRLAVSGPARWLMWLVHREQCWSDIRLDRQAGSLKATFYKHSVLMIEICADLCLLLHREIVMKVANGASLFLPSKK